jgi:hypothetical protein
VVAEAAVEEAQGDEDRDRAAEHCVRGPGGDHPDRGRAHRRQDRRRADLEHDDRRVAERHLGDGGRVGTAEAPQQRDPGRHRRLPLQGPGEEGACVGGVDDARLEPLAARGTEDGPPGLGAQREGQ